MSHPGCTPCLWPDLLWVWARLLMQLAVLMFQRHIIHINTVSCWLYFSFGTFDSFLADLGRNQVYGACCSAQMAHKPFRKLALRAFCPNIYTVIKGHISKWKDNSYFLTVLIPNFGIRPRACHSIGLVTIRRDCLCETSVRLYFWHVHCNWVRKTLSKLYSVIVNSIPAL